MSKVENIAVDYNQIFPKKRKANARLSSAGISRNLFVLSVCPVFRCAKTQTQTQVAELWESGERRAESDYKYLKASISNGILPLVVW
jgi:hypothetical protein